MSSIMYSLNNTGGFRISYDFGATWVTKTTANGLVSNDITKWKIDDANGAIYLVHNNLVDGVYKEAFSISYNNGETWTQVPNITDAIFSVSGTSRSGGIKAFDVCNGTIVMQLGDSGLMVSKNAGTSWQRLDNFFPLTGGSAILAHAAKVSKSGKVYAIFRNLEVPYVYTPNGSTYTTTALVKHADDYWDTNAFFNGTQAMYDRCIAILENAGDNGKDLVVFAGNNGKVAYIKNDLNLFRLRTPTSAGGYSIGEYYVAAFVDNYLHIGGAVSGGRGFVTRYNSETIYTHASRNTGVPNTESYHLTTHAIDSNSTSIFGPVNYIEKGGSEIFIGVQRGIIGSSPTTYGYYKKDLTVGSYFTKQIDSSSGSSTATWNYFSNIEFYKPTNSAPTNITLSPSAIAENSPAGSTVGSFSAVDAEGGAMVYSLVAGAGATDNSSFVIEGNALKTAAGVSLDYENKSSYSIRVKATDSGGLQFEKQLSVSVTNVNEVPSVISLSAQSISESAPVNSTIGVLSAVDPEGNAISYSVVSGGDKFNISGNALRNSVALDYEAATSHAITIRATDSLGATKDQSFTISVTDILTDNLFTVPAVTASTLNFRAFASTTDPKTGMVKLSDGSSLPVGSIVRFNGKRHMKSAGGAEAFVEITNVARPEWGWSQEGEEAWETLDLLHI